MACKFCNDDQKLAILHFIRDNKCLDGKSIAWNEVFAFAIETGAAFETSKQLSNAYQTWCSALRRKLEKVKETGMKQRFSESEKVLNTILYGCLLDDESISVSQT